MADFWKGYVSVNDDVRHTYEQVFYGRQLTGDNAPGMPGPDAASTPAAAPDAFNGMTSPSGMNPDVAEVYGTVWGNAPTNQGSALETYHQAMLAQQGSGSPQAGYPQLEPPTIEGTTGGSAPTIESPNQGNDMTPGY